MVFFILTVGIITIHYQVSTELQGGPPVLPSHPRLSVRVDRLGGNLRFAFRQPRLAVARYRRLLRSPRHPHAHQPHRFRAQSNFKCFYRLDL
jgi:hypothetical protein